MSEAKVKYETAAVPMHYLEDGRPFISDETLVNEPHVLEFVRRFPNYWVRAEQVGLYLCGVVGPINVWDING